MENKVKICVVGLGYVGLPLAITFAENGYNVIGFDLNKNKIEKYLSGQDPTNEVGDERIQKCKNIEFTYDEKKIKEADFIIVAVPTPVLENKTPDLKPLESSSEIVGKNLKKGTIVVYESTVYPGATEEVCLPVLEKYSGLVCGEDFKIGYSPERINPADKNNTLTTIVKIVSGMDKESLDKIAEVYGSIIKAGVHRASSIKVAEAAKVIENSQRDINIAFVNELALIFDRIGIDTLEVLQAAGTKWNFLPYRPGLVGGHCIGVDPYYLANKVKICVVGLGYVGLPLAITFAENGYNVIGFDLNKNKIEKYLSGQDPTNEVGDERIQKCKNIEFTYDEKKIKEADFIIVAVPTPVLENKTPDLKPLESSSEIVGKNLKKGTIVVYESTVYPGATEEVCLPVLEKYSGLVCGEDFKIGYSPERINPADKNNTLTTIVKIVSGMDKESLDKIAEVYGSIIKAGVHRASSIKVAEAAKVIENSQRDINIAFVNELALIFDRIGIDTLEVLQAAGTKWNFLPYRPGLVGGHCIGVDPYYLANKASELGYHAQVILAGRRINDGMAKFVAEKTIKKLINANIRVKGADILIMGLTFKENCPDLRNSKVNDIILELKEYGVNVHVVDPIAEKLEAKKEYGVDLEELKDIKNMDAVIVAVGHKEYRDMDIKELHQYYNEVYSKPLLVDVKSIFDKEEAEKEFDYWRL